MRPSCRRCLRPTDFCVCADLPVIPSRTRVVLLQHPRESRLAICSAWLTRISLENSELHRGVAFQAHPAVRAAAATPGAALLFPGEGAVPADVLADAPPSVLFVVDGTWPQAEKMLRATPALAALPRVGVAPERPSGYGDLRREPGPEHLSTAEAVALALGALERDPARFAPLVRAFRASVEKQLACARGERRSPRHRPGSRFAPGGPPGGPTSRRAR
jgi:tRNA-uridine aminocarboxypropyltransferase